MLYRSLSMYSLNISHFTEYEFNRTINIFVLPIEYVIAFISPMQSNYTFLSLCKNYGKKNEFFIEVLQF